MISQQRFVSVPSNAMRFMMRAICCPARAHWSRYVRASSSGMFVFHAAPPVNWVSAVATKSCRYNNTRAPRYMIWKLSVVATFGDKHITHTWTMRMARRAYESSKGGLLDVRVGICKTNGTSMRHDSSFLVNVVMFSRVASSGDDRVFAISAAKRPILLV
jgi:hypothetical protein